MIETNKTNDHPMIDHQSLVDHQEDDYRRCVVSSRHRLQKKWPRCGIDCGENRLTSDVDRCRVTQRIVDCTGVHGLKVDHDTESRS